MRRGLEQRDELGTHAALRVGGERRRPTVRFVGDDAAARIHHARRHSRGRERPREQGRGQTLAVRHDLVPQGRGVSHPPG